MSYDLYSYETSDPYYVYNEDDATFRSSHDDITQAMDDALQYCEGGTRIVWIHQPFPFVVSTFYENQQSRWFGRCIHEDLNEIVTTHFCIMEE